MLFAFDSVADASLACWVVFECGCGDFCDVCVGVGVGVDDFSIKFVVFEVNVVVAVVGGEEFGELDFELLPECVVVDWSWVDCDFITVFVVFVCCGDESSIVVNPFDFFGHMCVL